MADESSAITVPFALSIAQIPTPGFCETAQSSESNARLEPFPGVFECNGDGSTTTAKAKLLLDWLSIWPDGVGIVWATGKSDRKPSIDNSLHDLFHNRRSFSVGRLTVVPNHTFLL